MTDKKTLMVFTPLYNRAHTLPRLYESLKRQTDKDFIWFIIDDGSVDGGGELAESFAREGIVDIKFIRQNNAGKHVAHNKAVSMCENELFVCLDSDDWFEETAVEYIKRVHSEYKNENYFAYISPRKYPDDRRHGKNFYTHRTAAGFHDLYIKQHYEGETMIVFVTERIKRFAFPEFNGEKFLAENALYYQFGNPLSLFLPQSVYVFDYMEDGLSKNIINQIKNSPYGHLYNCKLGAVTPFLSYKSRVRSAANYYAMKTFFGIKENLIAGRVIPWYVAFPAAILKPILVFRNKKRFSTEGEK